MRAVSGRTVSERPISLSTASKILAKFVTVDNGACAATGVYLRKASNAFDELVQFHKGLKSSKSDRKSRKASTLPENVGSPRLEANGADSDKRKRTGVVEELVNGDGKSERRKHRSKERKAEDQVGIVSDENVIIGDKKIDKKKSKKKGKDVVTDIKLAVEARDGYGNAEGDGGRGHKRKKIEGAGVDREGDGSVEHRHKKKKRK